jgi:hypothetical protein
VATYLSNTHTCFEWTHHKKMKIKTALTRTTLGYQRVFHHETSAKATSSSKCGWIA